MQCHVDGVSLEVIFFSKKYCNRKFPSFKKNYISFPLFFQTPLLFPLSLHFESSSKLSSLYIIFYIKGTIVEKP